MNFFLFVLLLLLETLEATSSNPIKKTIEGLQAGTISLNPGTFILQSSAESNNQIFMWHFDSAFSEVPQFAFGNNLDIQPSTVYR